MIALIISDSKHETALLETYIKQIGYDTITYNWFMKALDNLEEISPSLIVLNAVDYPRHWKVLAQYIKDSFSTKIVLYVQDITEEEQKKAEYLNVLGYIKGFTNQDISDLKMLLLSDSEENEISQETKEGETKILFLNPKDGTICTGCGNFNDEQELIVNLDRNISLCPGDVLSDAALKTSQGIQCIQAEVSKVNESNLTLLVK